MSNRLHIDQDLLKSLLHYDPDSGIFTWKVSRGRVKAGKIAGRKSGEGYFQIQIFRRLYQSHRLAWIYMHGEIKSECIDHID